MRLRNWQEGLDSRHRLMLGDDHAIAQAAHGSAPDIAGTEYCESSSDGAFDGDVAGSPGRQAW